MQRGVYDIYLSSDYGDSIIVATITVDGEADYYTPDLQIQPTFDGTAAALGWARLFYTIDNMEYIDTQPEGESIGNLAESGVVTHEGHWVALVKDSVEFRQAGIGSELALWDIPDSIDSVNIILELGSVVWPEATVDGDVFQVCLFGDGSMNLLDCDPIVYFSGVNW